MSKTQIKDYRIFDESGNLVGVESNGASEVGDSLEHFAFKGTRGIAVADGHYTVEGGRILVFGDLHLSAVYQGTHKNYMLNCLKVMRRILQIVRESTERVSAVFFQGDVLGVNETTIKDHEFLEKVFQFFEALKNITGGNVYSVRGNHDVAEFPDFQFLIARGLLKAPKIVDQLGKDGVIDTRYHFVGWGEEYEELNIARGGASNIILCHNDVQVEGQTHWFGGKGVIQIEEMSNWNDIDMVLPGHIHNPSDQVMVAESQNGSTVYVFYIGSPTRVSQRYDECFYFSFWYNGVEVDAGAEAFGLWPADEEFYPKQENDELDEVQELEAERLQNLHDVVSDIIVSRIAVVSPVEQLRTIPDASEPAIQLAGKYLQEAMDSK